MPKSKKKAATSQSQIKVTIPPAEMPEVNEAMEWDGISNYAQFALAAIRQRVRRVKREKAAEEASAKIPRA